MYDFPNLHYLDILLIDTDTLQTMNPLLMKNGIKTIVSFFGTASKELPAVFFRERRRFIGTLFNILGAIFNS